MTADKRASKNRECQLKGEHGMEKNHKSHPAWAKDGIPERYGQPFCPHCGTKLELREQPEDGPEPWCPKCGTWRYPSFSSACSMIVLSPEGDDVLLIDQYGKKGILVAGYVLQGQDLETTVRREVSEEVGLRLESIEFNASKFFAPSNTLMVNFVCRSASREVSSDREVDSWRWVARDHVVDSMLPGSLAQDFVRTYLERSGL